MKLSFYSITFAFTLGCASVAYPQQSSIPPTQLKPEQRFHATLSAAQGSSPGKTSTVGGPTGDEYLEMAPPGAVLVGFDVWTGNYRNSLVIRGICPIFQSGNERSRGSKYGTCSGAPTTIEPKPGFAVGGIDAKGGVRVDGFQAIFMRINYFGFALASAGSYKSEWVGGKGGRESRLVPNEKPIIGIFGGKGAEIDRIGLLFYDRR